MNIVKLFEEFRTPEELSKKRWLNVDMIPSNIRNNIYRLVKSSGISDYSLDKRLMFLKGNFSTNIGKDTKSVINERMCRILIQKYLLDIKQNFSASERGNIIEEFIAGLLSGENDPSWHEINDVIVNRGITKGIYQIKFIKKGSTHIKFYDFQKYLLGNADRNLKHADYVIFIVEKGNSLIFRVLDVAKFREKYPESENIKVISDINNSPEITEFFGELFNTFYNKKYRREEFGKLKPEWTETIGQYSFVNNYRINFTDLDERTQKELDLIYDELKNVYDALGILIDDVTDLTAGVSLTKKTMRKRSYDVIAKSVASNTKKFTKYIDKLANKIIGK
jgi:hypothetical protein